MLLPLLLLSLPALAQNPLEPMQPPLPSRSTLTAADAALLEALLALLADQDAAAGAERLGVLADPRALWVLRHSVTTRDAAVAAAAARALGAFPEAASDLVGWVGNPDLADPVRVAAAQALGRLAQDAGAAVAADDAILAAMGQRGTSAALRADLRAVLAAHWPARLAEADRQVRRDGTAMLMAGSGIGMGYALAATGHFGQSGLEGLGGATGALGGATLGFVWGKTRPVENGPATFFTTTGVTGLVTGTTLGAWLDPDGEDGSWLGGVAGGAVGYGLGLGLWPRYPGTAGEAILAQGVGVAGGALAGGATALVYDNGGAFSAEAIAGTFGLGLAGGLAVGHATAPGHDMDHRDTSLIVASGLTGAFVGTAMPLGNARRSTLPVSTAAGGALLAYGLAPVADIGHDVTWGGMTGLTYGAVIGGGIGMLADPPGAPADTTGRGYDQGAEELPERLAITLGGAAGLVSGGALAAASPGALRFDDGVMVGLTTGWATWQTVGWSAATDPDPKLTGLLVLTPAVVGATTAVATPWLNVEFGDSLAATSLGLWGAYLGSSVGILADADNDTTLMLALGASDVGLLGGAVLMSPLVDASPVVVGVADAGGVLVGSTAALVTALFTEETDPILVASLVGAGAGAAGGAVLGSRLERGNRGSASLRLPGWPAGLELAPAYFANDAGGCWGGQASLSGW